MSIDSDIYDDFAELVGTFAAGLSPPMAVSYPGISFTPPAEGMWLEVRWFPNETQNYGIPNAGPFLMQGFGQVSACYRIGSGIVGGLSVAGAIVSALGKGTVLGRVKVERQPWISAVITEDDRLMHPITIPYRGLVVKP